jgi:hypothetical protein
MDVQPHLTKYDEINKENITLGAAGIANPTRAFCNSPAIGGDVLKAKLINRDGTMVGLA